MVLVVQPLQPTDCKMWGLELLTVPSQQDGGSAAQNAASFAHRELEQWIKRSSVCSMLAMDSSAYSDSPAELLFLMRFMPMMLILAG